MNKSQLIEAIASKADISKVKAGDAIDAFIGAVTHALKGGDVVTLIGFGSFSTAKRAARVGRNPKTKKEVPISPRRVVSFHASNLLTERMNKKEPR